MKCPGHRFTPRRSMLASSHAVGMGTFGNRRNDILCRIFWNTFQLLALIGGDGRPQALPLLTAELACLKQFRPVASETTLRAFASFRSIVSRPSRGGRRSEWSAGATELIDAWRDVEENGRHNPIGERLNLLAKSLGCPNNHRIPSSRGGRNPRGNLFDGYLNAGRSSQSQGVGREDTILGDTLGRAAMGDHRLLPCCSTSSF
jgi:hypothetical protein